MTDSTDAVPLLQFMSHTCLVEQFMSHTCLVEQFMSHTCLVEQFMSHTCLVEQFMSHTCLVEQFTSHTCLVEHVGMGVMSPYHVFRFLLLRTVSLDDHWLLGGGQAEGRVVAPPVGWGVREGRVDVRVRGPRARVLKHYKHVLGLGINLIRKKKS